MLTLLNIRTQLNLIFDITEKFQHHWPNISLLGQYRLPCTRSDYREPYLLWYCETRCTFVRGCLINSVHSPVNIRVSLVRFESSVWLCSVGFQFQSVTWTISVRNSDFLNSSNPVLCDYFSLYRGPLFPQRR